MTAAGAAVVLGVGTGVVVPIVVGGVAVVGVVAVTGTEVVTSVVAVTGTDVVANGWLRAGDGGRRLVACRA